MSSNTIRLIACRIYSLLFAAFGVGLIGGGFMLFYWSANGIPPELQQQISNARLPMDLSTFLVVVGAVCILIGGIHAALSIMACLGRVWPMVVGTSCWALMILPSLIRTETNPGQHKINGIMLSTLAVLTIAGLIPRIVSYLQADTRLVTRGQKA
jgi:hypothetical protein